MRRRIAGLTNISHDRVQPKTFEVLEPTAGKLARSVLRGAGGGDVPVPTRFSGTTTAMGLETPAMSAWETTEQVMATAMASA